MKTKTLFIGFMAVYFFIICCSACKQKDKKSEPLVKIENTLQSVHFGVDSIGISPSELLESIKRTNKAIEKIGYPDAGYKLWQFQSGTNKEVKYMIQGFWPNQAIYDTLHNNEFCKSESKAFTELLGKMRRISYNRFTIVK